MRCLFVFPNSPLSQNFIGGGAARYTQAFQALYRLGHDINVIRIIESNNQERITSFEQNLSEEDAKNYTYARSWLDIHFEYRIRRASVFEDLRTGILSPLSYAYSHTKPLHSQIQQVINDLEPDFILAEMMPAGAILAILKPQVPWIYGHHDWEYRVRQIRNALQPSRVTLRKRFRNWVLRRAEELVVKRSSGVIAASGTDATDIRRQGVDKCIVLPVTYPSVSGPSPNDIPGNMRIVHLANLNRTINVEALQSYLNQVTPFLPKNWEFVTIGAMERVLPDLVDQLKKIGTKIEGFVPDLGTVLRPFDVAIIPYEYDTGERTKVPLLFNYAQVVVSTEAAVQGSSSYLQSGKNCIVLESLAEFPVKLKYLADHPHIRRQIGLAARATFERELTLEAQLPKFEQIIDVVTHQV